MFEGDLEPARRRSRLEIVLSVLSAIRDGVDKPTRIMYATNLSWRPVQRVLRFLVEQGLVVEVNEGGERRSKVRYRLTDKGFEVVNYFERAKDLIAIEEFPL
jgi:predicted transcriptional regulator